MTPPLLLLDRALLDLPGASPRDLRLDGPRALLLGDASFLLAPLLHRAPLVSGSFLVQGQPLEQLDPRSLGGVPLDPPLPLNWSPLEYVTWSARLAGLPPAAATTSATQHCHELGLGAWSSRPLGQLHAVFRRITVLAHALVTAPSLLLLEAPLAGLAPDAASYLVQAISVAIQGRAALITSPPFLPEDPAARLAAAVDHLVDLDVPSGPTHGDTLDPEPPLG